MITFRVWDVLSKPPRLHPLYRRMQVPRSAESWMQTANTLLAPYVPLTYLFGGMTMCCALSSHALTLLIAVAVAVLFNGTLYALKWGTGVAREIAIARESGEWELLCLIPEGSIGAVWAMATGVSHRDNAFSRLFHRHIGVLAVLLAFFVVMLPCSLLDYSNPRKLERPDLIVTYGYLLAALAVSYVDYVQSAVLGSLTGILGGLQTDSPVDAQLWAGGVFLALQAAVYALIIIFCFVLLPPLPTQITGQQLIVEGALLLLRLVFFIGVREVVIVAVWRRVARRLQANVGDLSALRQAG